MSLLTRTLMECERTSAMEFAQELSRDEGLQIIMREQGLRAAMQAAARQADSRRGPVHQNPGPAGHPDPRSAGARSGRPDPIGAPIANNSQGQPEVRVVGRARPAKPIRTAKSGVVPEPDQVTSRRPEPRPVTGPLEPRG
jgi:hypothetical protein